MADTKTTDLATGTPDPATDWFGFVDVSDTTMAAAGTNKKVLHDNLRFSMANAASGATQRTVKAKFAEIPSVLDVIPSSEHAGIKARTSTYDCTADFATAIAWEAGGLYVPDGRYCYSGLIAFGNKRIHGDGTSGEGLSELIATAAGARCTLSSWGVVTDMYFNGNYVGDCGLILLPSTQGQRITSVKARLNNLGGIVFDKTQNFAAYKCNAENNLYNYLFLNGAKNGLLSACNGRLDEATATATYSMANQRNIMFDNITSSAYFSTSVLSGGNGGITFESGIYEDGSMADANFEVVQAGGRIELTSLELVECSASGALIKVANGGVRIERCTLGGPATGGNTIKLVDVTGGTVTMDALSRRGNAGKYSPGSGIFVTAPGTFNWIGFDDCYDFIIGDNRNFRGSLGDWVPGSTGTATWSADDGGSLIVGSTIATNGAAITIDALKQAALETAAGRRAIRVIVDVLEIVGGDQRVVALISGNRRLIGTMPAVASGNNGAHHEFVYRPSGDETGVLGIYGTASATVTGKYKQVRVVLL